MGHLHSDKVQACPLVYAWAISGAKKRWNGKLEINHIRVKHFKLVLTILAVCKSHECLFMGNDTTVLRGKVLFQHVHTIGKKMSSGYLATLAISNNSLYQSAKHFPPFQTVSHSLIWFFLFHALSTGLNKNESQTWNKLNISLQC